jgi:hypothetical protein
LVIVEVLVAVTEDVTFVVVVIVVVGPKVVQADVAVMVAEYIKCMDNK